MFCLFVLLKFGVTEDSSWQHQKQISIEYWTSLEVLQVPYYRPSLIGCLTPPASVSHTVAPYVPFPYQVFPPQDIPYLLLTLMQNSLIISIFLRLVTWSLAEFHQGYFLKMIWYLRWILRPAFNIFPNLATFRSFELCEADNLYRLSWPKWHGNKTTRLD